MRTKRYRFMLAMMAFFMFIRLGHAEQSAEPTPSQDKSKNEISIFEKCKFVVKNTMNGEFDKWIEGGNVWIRRLPRAMDLNIPLTCYYRGDEKSLEMELGAKQVNGKWHPAGGYEKGCDRAKFLKTRICEFVKNLPFMPEEHMRTIPLSGVNWEGIGVLVDDVTGEERTRQRNFRYCLYHAELALCGVVYVRNLMKPHQDVLSTVLKVLNSIEFVDDVPPNPPETPTR